MGGRVNNEQSASKQQERKFKDGGIVEKSCGGMMKNGKNKKDKKEGKK